jgi:hypothetical protein
MTHLALKGSSDRRRARPKIMLAFNSISREFVELPLTRKQQDDIRAQRPKLEPEEVDKNIYRHPAIRERAPRDMPKRRKPGWVCR